MKTTALLWFCNLVLLALLVGGRIWKPAAPAAPAAADPVDSRQQDLAGMLKASLEQEQKVREELAKEQARLQQTLALREKELAERTEEAAHALQQLQAAEMGFQRAEQERSRLQQLYARADQMLKSSSQEVQVLIAQAELSKEEVALLEKELIARQAELRSLQSRLEQSEKVRQAAELERERLSGELKLAVAERSHYREQLDLVRGELKRLREERSAEDSRRATTPRATEPAAPPATPKPGEDPPSAAPSAAAPLVLTIAGTAKNGRAIPARDLPVVVVQSGKQLFAVCHLAATPFPVQAANADLEQFSVLMKREDTVAALGEVHFLKSDPRILLLPLTEPARQLLRNAPLPVGPAAKLGDSVQVLDAKGLRGTFRFQPDTQLEHHFLLVRPTPSQRSSLVPGPGDLVVTESGEALGLMVNRDYCVSFRDLTPAAVLPTGTHPQTGTTLNQLHLMVTRMPDRLR